MCLVGAYFINYTSASLYLIMKSPESELSELEHVRNTGGGIRISWGYTITNVLSRHLQLII